MDCYDWVHCPGTCDECDIWIDEMEPLHRRVWLRARRWVLERCRAVESWWMFRRPNWLRSWPMG